MMTKEASAETTVRNIRRKTRRKYTAEEKIRIVLEGLRGDLTIAELCRREGISENLYYRWSKDFLEAGKSCLVGDTKREANSKQVKTTMIYTHVLNRGGMAVRSPLDGPIAHPQVHVDPGVKFEPNL